MVELHIPRSGNVWEHYKGAGRGARGMSALDVIVKCIQSPFQGRAILSALAAAGFTVAPVKLLDAARACMRETGWQLAPANIAQGSEGILELACAEVCEQMGDLLIAAAHHAMLAAAEKGPQP